MLPRALRAAGLDGANMRVLRGITRHPCDERLGKPLVNMDSEYSSRAMRAATIRDNEIVIEEHPDPVPGSGEVLVRVRAAGLNGADMMQRRGLYPAPPGSPQDIPGMELAGEVVALGPRPGRSASRWAIA